MGNEWNYEDHKNTKLQDRNEWLANRVQEEGRFHTGILRSEEIERLEGEAIPLMQPRTKTFGSPLVIYINNHEGAHRRFNDPGSEVNSIDDLACRVIQRNVQSFVEAHRAAGFIVTVENHPKQPFAMGYTEPLVEVRKVNSRPPEPKPNDYDKMAAEAMERIKSHIELVAADFSIVSAYEHRTAMDAMHSRHWYSIKAHRARCAPFIKLSPVIWTGGETPSEAFKRIMRQKYFAGGLVK